MAAIEDMAKGHKDNHSNEEDNHRSQRIVTPDQNELPDSKVFRAIDKMNKHIQSVSPQRRILYWTLSILFNVLVVLSFIGYIALTLHHGYDVEDSRTKRLNHIAAGAPGTREVCSVTQVDIKEISDLGDDLPANWLQAVVHTKDCGDLQINSAANLKGIKVKYMKSLLHSIQNGQTYNFWIEKTKKDGVQVYRADLVKNNK